MNVTVAEKKASANVKAKDILPQCSPPVKFDEFETRMELDEFETTPIKLVEFDIDLFAGCSCSPARPPTPGSPLLDIDPFWFTVWDDIPLFELYEKLTLYDGIRIKIIQAKPVESSSSDASELQQLAPPVAPAVTFARRTSSGRYVNYSRDDLDSEISNTEYANYTVHIPPTPDNQPMANYSVHIPPTPDNQLMTDPTISQRVEEQLVSSSIFTGGFNVVTRAHLMDKVIDTEANHPQMAGTKGSSCAVRGCDGNVMSDGRGLDILPCECDFKICRDCYIDAVKTGDAICPGCKEPYKNTDLDEMTGETPLPLAVPSMERRFSKNERSMSRNERRLSLMKSKGASAPMASHGSMLMRSQTGDFDHSRWLFETKGTYGYGNAIWPEQGGPDTGNDNGNGDVHEPHDFSSKPWRPLTRKIKIRAAILSPYRLLIFIRMVVLGLFLTWRVRHKNEDAIWLWGMSVVCEIWFAFSWLLDQLPKLCPVNRATDLNVLKEKFETPTLSNPTGKSDLPGVDVFVSTADPEKEPPLVTSNTILSILAADYPVEKLACYVSDDGGALLTFEAMAEAASFANVWVPFCRKHNIEPRNPESYFSLKKDPTKNKVRTDFVKDRRRIKREYDEYKVRINGLPDSIRRRSDAYHAREEIKALKLQRQNPADEPLDAVKIPKATWMADGTHWPGTWMHPSPEHSKGDHAGIIQVNFMAQYHLTCNNWTLRVRLDTILGGKGRGGGVKGDKLVSQSIKTSVAAVNANLVESGGPSYTEKFKGKGKANLVGNVAEWVLDTGASRHLCGDKGLFAEFEEVADGECVYMGNSSSAMITGKGYAQNSSAYRFMSLSDRSISEARDLCVFLSMFFHSEEC
ncbi:cellulose synthase-like protein D3 [Silene latifolia]|uniref:cellulose synthase-like protein D3 n=1 Tax=Silene latifolia TaxID=37657 RepID=UPI003D77DC60